MAEIRDTTDVIGYFMKLEEKYWGLFFISLLVLFFFLDWKKRKIISYGIVSYAFFLFPLTIYAMVKFFPGLILYYPIRWICQMLLFICLAITTIIVSLIEKGQKKEAIVLFGAFICLIFLSGVPVFLADNDVINHESGLEQDFIKGYHIMAEDMNKNNLEQAYIWGPKEWMSQSRIYNTNLRPIYGKDIWDDSPLLVKSQYEEEREKLYQFYSYYEAEDSPVVNKEEQLNALIGALLIYSDIPCDYIAVFKSNQYWLEKQEDEKDKEEVIETVKEPDVIDVFTRNGYEFVGEAGNLFIFRCGQDGKAGDTK